ncbi:MAG TPA: helix-turn-helix domain-containing protein [Stellaceae bacterium]|jgi:DNA-binding IclR family transcriptional regulator|nr:helix-turn-helix domain-containing protein [Stellaceae bacterium]
MSSITRAFEILERFRQVQRPLSLTDLVRDFGYPSSSVADILKTLSRGGYVSFDPITRTYFPTTRLGELGDWIMTDLLPHSYPVATLRQLREATGQTVLLGTPNELEVLYLAVLESAQDGRATSGRRTHRPLVKSGVGNALLSLEEDRFIERVYRRSLARGLCTREELPLKALMQRIVSCRQAGYAFIRDSFNPIAAIVAAPLPVSSHAQRLAIAVGGPAERIEAHVPEIGEVLLAHVRPLAQADPAVTLR